MDKEKFAKGMTFLGIAYNKEFTKEQLEVWYSMLKDYSSEEFSTAIQELIKTEERLPSIATITKQIAKNKTVGLPEAEDEWQEVLRAVGRYGTYREDEALQSLKPYTAKITKYIGFRRICMASPEEQIWNKKEFLGEYDSLKDKLVENLQIGITTEETKMLTTSIEG